MRRREMSLHRARGPGTMLHACVMSQPRSACSTNRTLAGPISRGDAATAAQHLEQLRALPLVYGAIYRSLSQELVALARHKGAPVAALADIEKLLQG